MRIFACAYGGYRTIFTPYAELHHYEFTSRSREEASEEKLRRWKREQALFMQHWLEFFLTGDPWLGPNLSSECVYGCAEKYCACSGLLLGVARVPPVEKLAVVRHRLYLRRLLLRLLRLPLLPCGLPSYSPTYDSRAPSGQKRNARNVSVTGIFRAGHK